jgi:uncharacterized protein (TIGR00255 family)
MTGYGEARDNTPAGVVSVEMISVNHKNLDLRLRLPNAFRFIEIDIRNLLKEKLRRGHVEVAVKVETDPDPESAAKNITLNLSTALAYHREAVKLYKALKISNKTPVSDWIFKMENVWSIPEPINRETIKKTLLFLTSKALTALVTARESEGATLEVFLKKKTRALLPIMEKITRLKSEIPAQTRASLETRLKKLNIDNTVSPDRLAQEIALLVQRADITEEVSRLGAHINRFLEKIHQPDTGGKELDFIIQEMNREANTISSKSTSYNLSTLVIQLKETINQLREQVQNVE